MGGGGEPGTEDERRGVSCRTSQIRDPAGTQPRNSWDKAVTQPGHSCDTAGTQPGHSQCSTVSGGTVFSRARFGDQSTSVVDAPKPWVADDGDRQPSSEPIRSGGPGARKMMTGMLPPFFE